MVGSDQGSSTAPRNGCLNHDMVAGMSNGTPSTPPRQLQLKACLVLLPRAAQPKATADAQCRGAGGGCTCAWMVGERREAWMALLSGAARRHAMLAAQLLTALLITH